MVITQSKVTTNNGPQGIQTAAEAEKLVAMLWETVLDGMTKTAFSTNALGTGADLFNNLATNAAAQEFFNEADSQITSEIMNQLSSENARGRAKESASIGSRPFATLSVLGASTGLTPETAGPGTLVNSLTGADSTSMVDRAISYAQQVWPSLKRSAASLGVSAIALLAQSALETGWGVSVPGNNLFGIKAAAGQPCTIDSTDEFTNGAMRPEVQGFASFPSISEAVSKYTDLIRNKFSTAVGASSVAQYAYALASEGYATDPNYAQKVIEVAQSPLMGAVLQSLGEVMP